MKAEVVSVSRVITALIAGKSSRVSGALPGASVHLDLTGKPPTWRRPTPIRPAKAWDGNALGAFGSQISLAGWRRFEPSMVLLQRRNRMLTIGYIRVSTDRQAEQGVSLEAQDAKVRAMATVQSAKLDEVIVDGGESAKSLNRRGLQRLLSLVKSGKVRSVIIAKLDRLTRSVKDLCDLLELFDKKNVVLVAVAESLDTASAAGRLVITIMGVVSQWEREALVC
jgi:predicted site-specific integrase-resolvase